MHELYSPPSADLTAADRIWIDNLSYSVRREDFEAKTLRVLSLARAGLFYLSLAMYREERRRAEGRDGSLMMPMALDFWEDDWKR